MKITASMLVFNEMGRYLQECVGHLQEFCDEIAVLDNGSTDGGAEWLEAQPKVRLLRADNNEFFHHEGRNRQKLLEWVMEGTPTHILAIDADEFVADGQQLRACTQDVYSLSARRSDVWTLLMEEVWELDGDCICVRHDGGWHPHPVPIFYRVPDRVDPRTWRIQDRALACGREPIAIRNGPRRTGVSGTEILHFGWANEEERVARHHRYAVSDGGKFHRSTHLDSILWGDDRVVLRGREWPSALAGVRDAVTVSAGYIRPVVAAVVSD